MIATLLGGLLGGLFRFLPELLKYLDAKNDRQHELAMQDKMLAFQQLKGDQRVEEIQTQGQQDWNTGALEAIKSAIVSQAEMKSGIKILDALSMLVRPMITYAIFGLYCIVKIAHLMIVVVVAWQSTDGNTAAYAVAIGQAITSVWGESDMAMLGSILNFWFLGRVFDRVK